MSVNVKPLAFPTTPPTINLLLAGLWEVVGRSGESVWEFWPGLAEVLGSLFRVFGSFGEVLEGTARKNSIHIF